jgi:6-phosphogluconolactonase (cycloisomerase 2 family)
MKFRKFGKALLMSAVSVGAVISVTSCVESYTVGFLYVTGNQTTGTSGSSGQGIISGFKIDHNTGRLREINGMPIASGGANPGRAVLIQGSRFLYVLNRGVDASGGDNCTSATSPCTGANITQFSVGGNGVLSEQEQFYTQGGNPMRIVADSTGSHIYILDHDSPSAASCALALGPSTTACGDITAFTVEPSTGRLSLLVNAQVTSASGQPLPYFPVPADPIDLLITGSNILTLTGTPTTGDSVYPYTYSPTSGQLTVSQNGPQPLNIYQATAIQTGSGFIYVLDNEAPNPNPTGAVAQVLPFTLGTGGALQAQTGGAVPDDPTESNPQYLVVESKGKWVYVANSGDNANTTDAQSGITGYVIDTTTRQLTPMSGSPFASPVGIGAGPECLVEDPSDQYFYTANFNDSTVTGVDLDPNSGILKQLQGTAARATALPGPAAYCLVDGRTS